MRPPRLQFGLRALFVVLTAAAVFAWWPKHGRPWYEAWDARAKFRRALYVGDDKAFVIHLERLEAVINRQRAQHQLWESHEDRPPDCLPVDEVVADECLTLLGHSSARVRVLAALAVSLIRRQPAAEVPRLTEMLDDSSPQVRAMAAYGLRCYRDEAQSAVPTLARIVKHGWNDSHIDMQAAWDAMLDLDSWTAMKATGTDDINWLRAPWRQRPSEVADHFLGQIYPDHQSECEDRLVEQSLQEKLKSSSDRLAAAANEAERDDCRNEIAKLKFELQQLHDYFSKRRAELADAK